MIAIFDADSGEKAAEVTFSPYEFETTDAAGPAVEQVLDTLEDLGQMNRETAIEANPFAANDAPIENQPTSMEGNDPPSRQFLIDTLARRVRPGYVVETDPDSDDSDV
jgi:hypothetical protein